MAYRWFRNLVPAIVWAVLATGAVAPPVRADSGELILQFRSELQTAPAQQGWENQAGCLSGSCPGSAHGSGDPTDYVCYYQGWQDLNYDLLPDNSCTNGIGCRKPKEHYNAPPLQIINGACTYTEWLCFDNGDNQSGRPLTIWDSLIAGSPPFGAPGFIGAPAWPVLRISTGDGNLVPNSLPILVTGPQNYRNQGLARVSRSFSPSSMPITLVCNVAAGPRSFDRPFVGVRAFNHRFSFGVDGDQSSPNYGKIVFGDDASGHPLGVLFDRAVVVAQPSMSPPHDGEFFVLRAILRPDGSFSAYLNEDPASLMNGQVAPGSSGTEISLAPDLDDATMWVDYVTLFEGEITPPCPGIVFDMNGDHAVDQADLDMFTGCATGPGHANGYISQSSPCRCVDANGDGSIDMVDFAAFQRCMTTGTPGTANPDPSCNRSP